MNVQGRKKTLGRQKLRGISRFLGIKCLCVAAGGQTEPSVSFYSTVSFWAATSLTLMQNKLVPKPLLAMSWLSVYCLSTHTEKWGKLVSFHEVISAPISMLRCFLHMKNKNAPLSWRNLIFLASWDQQLWYFPLKIKQNNLFELVIVFLGCFKISVMQTILLLLHVIVICIIYIVIVLRKCFLYFFVCS